jgi:iron(III) transport system ATP-binding protein
MSQNFLEINDVTFAASKKNKVNNVTFNIEKEGPNKQIISPSFSILKVTLLTLFFLLAAKVTSLISKKFWLIKSINYQIIYILKQIK